jgi:hypothetical protein
MKMSMFDIKLLAVSALFAASTSALAAPLGTTNYATLTGPDVQTVDFEDLDQQSGAVYFNDVIVSNGVRFGEHFAGQQLTNNGVYDALGSSTAGGRLAVVAGEPDQNLMLDTNSLGNTRLVGLSADDRGGSLAMMFASDQSSFGFQAVRNGSGDSFLSATVKFFGADGSLIDSQVITIKPDSDNDWSHEYFAFSHGAADIRGVSIEQNGDDGAFLWFDNFKYGTPAAVAAVPEPETYALMLAGLSVVGFAKRRRHTRSA